jgi:AraC-like DNA-binding protein
MVEPHVAEGLLRGAAIGGFAVSGGELAAAPVRAPARWTGTLFFLAAIGHVLDNYSALRGASTHASIVTWMMSALGPSMFWAFTVTLFTDDPKFPPRRLLPGAIALALALGTEIEPRLFSIAYAIWSTALVVRAFFVIAQGWQGDLVEQRRRLRTPLLLLSAAYVLVMAILELGGDVGLSLEIAPLLQAGALAVLAVAAAITLLRVDEVLLGPPMRRPLARAEIPSDDPLFRHLLHVLDVDEIWRREGLTIGALAQLLSVPEHRLRRLINGKLGYRNFAGLLNERRVIAAKRELSASKKPISTIAFDLGFGSLGPFNRAFKLATGVTPSAWRQSPDVSDGEILAES